MYDVIVIGGGVTGSRVAYGLAKTGYDVLVIEQKASVADNICCTGIVSEKCVNEFGIENKWITRCVNGATLFTPSGKSIKIYAPQSVAVVLDRETFTTGMADRAICAGAKYLFNAKVDDIVTDSLGGARAHFVSGRFTDWVAAKVVVMASGSNSSLTKIYTKGGGYYLGAQAEVATSLTEIEVHFGQSVAPSFFAWLVPTKAGKAKVGLLSQSHPAHHLRQFINKLNDEGKIMTGDYPIMCGAVLVKPPAQTYMNRMLMVGGCAGQVKPTTGGGIYYGLICADIAVKVLHKALASNDFTKLAEYQDRWQAKIGKELKIGHALRKFYRRLNDADIEKLLGRLDTHKIDGVDFDWHGGWLARQFLLNPPIGLLKPILKAYLRLPA